MQLKALMNAENNSKYSGSQSVDHLTCLTQWLSVCSKALSRLFNVELAALDVSPVEFMLLWTCGQTRSAAMSQNQLASMNGISAAQLSQTAERLRQRGWIVLTRDKADRRRQSLELTPQGAAKLQSAVEQLKEPARKLACAFASPMHTELLAFLRQFAPSVQQFAIPAAAKSAAGESQEKRAA